MTVSLQRQHLCFKDGENGNHVWIKMEMQVNKSDWDCSDMILKEKIAFITRRTKFSLSYQSISVSLLSKWWCRSYGETFNFPSKISHLMKSLFTGKIFFEIKDCHNPIGVYSINNKFLQLLYMRWSSNVSKVDYFQIGNFFKNISYCWCNIGVTITEWRARIGAFNTG